MAHRRQTDFHLDQEAASIDCVATSGLHYSDGWRGSSGVPRNFVRGGGGSQQIQLRTERMGIW